MYLKKNTSFNKIDFMYIQEVEGEKNQQNIDV